MEEQSRVKKFEDLRQSLNEENNENLEMSTVLDELKNTVSQNNEGKGYVPSHKQQPLDEHLVEETGEFKNEYLDSFIQEVRDYNIRKGVRDNEDTRLDILQQLSAKQRKKRSNYLEDVALAEAANTESLIDEQNGDIVTEEMPVYEGPSEENIASTQEIARQVQELLNQPETMPEEIVEEIQEEPIVAPIIEPELESKEDISNKFADTEEIELSDTSSFTRDQLLEETLKLKVQLDEYEDELNSLNSDVSKNNRLLNVIIGILIMMLLGVIGLVIYWLTSGGYF